MELQEGATLDSETRSHDDHQDALRLWLRLLTCTNLVENNLRGFLREEFGGTLPRFDFMAQPDRYPKGLTMGDLSQLMMVSGGNVTGIARQLGEEGLISRQPTEQDKRVFKAKKALTSPGWTCQSFL